LFEAHHGGVARFSVPDRLAAYLTVSDAKRLYGYPGESTIEFMEAAQRTGMEPGTGPLVIKARVDSGQCFAQF
jgi:thiamine pyrophosphate-dependent acetolactate synthase large subunit-like protein